MSKSIINVSAIQGTVGRILRWPLHNLVPDNLVMPVLQGPMRGMRWVTGASNHGCWLGSYETPKQLRMLQVLKPGMVVYDVGAHTGFYTLLFSRLVGGKGLVVAFEPLPRNLTYLRRHLTLNHLNNVIVKEVAVGDTCGTATFELGKNSSMGRLGEGPLHVDVVSLDRAIAEGLPPPHIIKMDIEGGEYKALLGATELFDRYRPILFLATHGAEIHAKCCRWLQSKDYHLESLNSEPLETTSELVCLPDNERGMNGGILAERRSLKMPSSSEPAAKQRSALFGRSVL